MSDANLAALLLSLKLAFFSTVILLVISTPIAWWLAFSRNRLRPVAEALVALPMVLPPTVLGFYLLLAFSPTALPGKFWESISGGQLAFSFSGLVIASVIYSLPFVVQPLQAGFRQLNTQYLEAAASLGAKKIDRFFTITVPLCRAAFITAAGLGFAHTLGEFGVVLMIGGNIPGETQVVSIAIYDHVESMRYDEAHQLAAILLFLSASFLIALYTLQHANHKHAK